MFLFGVEIPRERLAVVCIAAAVLLMLFSCWSAGIVRKVRYRGRYERGFQPEPYTAHRKDAHRTSQIWCRLACGTSQSPRRRSRRRYGWGFHRTRNRNGGLKRWYAGINIRKA